LKPAHYNDEFPGSLQSDPGHRVIFIRNDVQNQSRGRGRVRSSAASPRS